ncbi:MAG: hypothetical protein RLZZ254_1321 [Actinomycetota bacterium]
MLVELELEGVRLEVPSSVPVMMLRETAGRRRVIPIYIGGPEASAIHYALEGIVPERPLTHDLMLNMIGELGHQVDKLVLTEVKDHTYFAELSLDGGEYTVSCRPSDGVAVAIRAGVQIFAAESLVDEVGREVVSEGAETEEIIDDFREFINNISPEDFSQ